MPGPRCIMIPEVASPLGNAEPTTPHRATQHRTQYPGRRRLCAVNQPKFWQNLFTKCSYVKFVYSENQTSGRIYIPEQTGKRSSPRAADSHLTGDRTKGPSCLLEKNQTLHLICICVESIWTWYLERGRLGTSHSQRKRQQNVAAPKASLLHINAKSHLDSGLNPKLGQ